MSDECCGSDRPGGVEAVRAPAVRVVHEQDDGCCAPAPRPGAGRGWAVRTVVASPPAAATTAPPPVPVVEDDACCGGPDPKRQSSGADEDEGPRPPWWRDPALAPSAAAGVLLVASLVLGRLDVPGPVVLGLEIGSLAFGAWTFVPGALRRLARGRLGVGLLMTIASVGAVALGHVGEAAALAFLFSLAEALEDRAMDRAKEGLRALLDLIPATARVRRDGQDVTVPARDLVRGDVLVIAAGERVSTDAEVIEGRSALDTAAVTGESIPVEVAPGDEAPAGSVNGAGALLVRASADGTDNSLTQIVALVEQAHARKGERARLADRIARPLVPAVLIVAALVVVYGFVVGDPATWIERALVVLVAASPCALAIAVPVTVISGIGSASRFGVIVKSGEAFEKFGTVRAVALDKTGTLTRNRPEVVDVVTTGGHDRQRVLALAAALEATSTHPLAAAVVAAAPDAPTAKEVVETAGHGIAGTADGSSVQVGSDRWLDPGPLKADAQRLAEQGMTAVVVHVDGSAAGLIGVRDELRPEAAETVQMLDDLGVSTTMITGDNRRTAAALAAEAGITAVLAEQRPQDKAAAVERLRAEQPTAMVGDGINDAPALATATVGIAMGATGSAAAVESADVAFTGTDLRMIPAALAHVRRGRRIMGANILLALAIIIVLFPLALFGVLGLAGVVLVHEIAEVVVILNGVRAARRPAALRRLERTPPEPVDTVSAQPVAVGAR